VTFLMKVREIKEIEVEGLGKRIRDARVLSTKTLKSILEEVGLSRAYWYGLEKENIKGALSIENLRKIERVLDVDLEVDLDAAPESTQ